MDALYHIDRARTTANESAIKIIVNTTNGGVPMNIYNPDFSWRQLVFPPIKSIIVAQGHHSAEIGDYDQYNFLIEVTQRMVGFGSSEGTETATPRKFIVMGCKGTRVDLYEFSIMGNVITKFTRDTEAWGSEYEGASTTGWKKGLT